MVHFWGISESSRSHQLQPSTVTASSHSQQPQPAVTASNHSQSYSQSHTDNHIEQRREEEVAKRGSRGGTARERKERGKRERGKKGGTELVVPNPCCQKVNQQSSTSTTIPHSKPRFQKRAPLENKPSSKPPLGPAVAVVCCGCASCGSCRCCGFGWLWLWLLWLWLCLLWLWLL